MALAALHANEGIGFFRVALARAFLTPLRNLLQERRCPDPPVPLSSLTLDVLARTTIM